MAAVDRKLLEQIARTVGAKHGINWALVGPMIIDLVQAGYTAGLEIADKECEGRLAAAFDRGWNAAREQPNVSLVSLRRNTR